MFNRIRPISLPASGGVGGRFRPGRLTAILLFALAALLVVCGAHMVRADGDTADTGKELQFSNPLDGATVRETVNVEIPRASLPPDGGYVSISIDGVFRLATALPDTGDSIWSWDTKAPYQAPDSDEDQFTKDGSHTLVVTVYDHANNVWGTAKATVTVANNISSATLQDGVKLAYRWAKYPEQTFSMTTSLDSNTSGSGLPAENLQNAKFEFLRTAEADDPSSGTYRVEDKVLPGGIIYSKSSANYVESLYTLKGKNRTVDDYGQIIRNELPISPGSHFAFDIPQFKEGRVVVGSAWATTMPVYLQWAVEDPGMVQGSARLDAFEWEDHYPTAKIIESYDGPANIPIDNPSAPIPAANQVNVKITRTIWFAYGLGRVVRESTDLKVDGSFTSAQVQALGFTGMSGSENTGPNQGGSPQQNPFASQAPSGDQGFQQAPTGGQDTTSQATAEMTFHMTSDMVAVVGSGS